MKKEYYIPAINMDKLMMIIIIITIIIMYRLFQLLNKLTIRLTRDKGQFKQMLLRALKS